MDTQHRVCIDLHGHRQQSEGLVKLDRAGKESRPSTASAAIRGRRTRSLMRKVSTGRDRVQLEHRCGWSRIQIKEMTSEATGVACRAKPSVGLSWVTERSKVRRFQPIYAAGNASQKRQVACSSRSVSNLACENFTRSGAACTPDSTNTNLA